MFMWAENVQLVKWPFHVNALFCFCLYLKIKLQNLYHIDCSTYFQVKTECGYCIIIFHLELTDFLPVSYRSIKQEKE